MVAPKALLPWLARLAHGSGHTSKRRMQEEVLQTWHAPGFAAVAEIFCRSCVPCQHHNVGRVCCLFGCWLHRWLGHGCAADVVSLLPVYWCSFRQLGGVTG